MGERLNPSPLQRLTELARPDWVRTVAARRIAAAVLVILAAVAALRPDPGDERVAVVVAARDLSPGAALTEDDVRIETTSATAVPDGVQTDLSTVVGSRPAGPVRRGEALTDVRLLSPRLAEATAGPNARIVPLTLGDSAVLDLLRTGDVVDVLAAGADAESDDARVVATDAIVVVVSPKATGATAGADRVVLVALPAQAANAVAAAALVQGITVTLH